MKFIQENLYLLKVFWYLTKLFGNQNL